MAAAAIISYLLGAIPTGYIITRKVLGVDIRTMGSGNPGAANVYRTVGAKAGWATFIVDALKGFVSVQVSFMFVHHNYVFAAVCGMLAIAGHMWTIFLNFRGGKGVATAAGVFGALLPVPTGIAFAVFALAVWYSGHISVGSIIAAVVLPVASFFIGPQPMTVNIVASVVGILVIYRHIPNMKRLMQNKELNFEDGSKKKENENK